MKDSKAVLYPNDHVAAKVTSYSEDHTLDLPKEIIDYHAWIVETQEMSNYTISTFQAKSHVWLARLIDAKRILEIGSYLGFSAAIWSHAVGPSGIVTGLEFNPDYASTASRKLTSEPLNIKNVNFIVGAAADSLQTLSPSEPYDLVFVDADKGNYPTYLSLLLSLSAPGQKNRILRKGALIVADNVLRRGIVADPSDENPYAVETRRDGPGKYKHTEHDLGKLDEFNKEMARTPRVESWLMPLWDGVMVGRLVD